MIRISKAAIHGGRSAKACCMRSRRCLGTCVATLRSLAAGSPGCLWHASLLPTGMTSWCFNVANMDGQHGLQHCPAAVRNRCSPAEARPHAWQRGREPGVSRLCSGFGQLEAVCTEVGDCGYARARTLYVASKPRHVGRLQEEAKAALALPLNGWMADGSGRCSASARREGS